MDAKSKLFRENFIAPVQKTGRNTLLMASACLFLPGLYLYFFHGLIPPFDVLMRSIIAVWSFMVVIAVIEPIVYYPILGLGGTYMSFLAGNALNLRVPVSATVQQVVGTSEGSPEAEIVSTLGIAGSLFASITVMIVGTLMFLPLLGKIQGSGSAVGVGLDQVLPALFGALAGIFLFKVPKLGIVPLILGIVTALFKKDLSYAIVIPPMVIISIISARIMYKKNWIKGEGMM